MAVTAKQYGQAIVGQYGTTSARRIDWTGDDIYCALLTASYTPDQDTHDFFNDVSATECTGTGYTAGGVVLGTKSINYDTATNRTQLRAANSVFTTVTVTTRYAVVYKAVGGVGPGTPASSPLLGYVDFGATQTISGVTFTLDWDDTEGVLRTTVS